MIEGLFESLYNRLEDSGISGESFGFFLGFYLATGILWSMILWIFCYFFNPTRTILSKIPFNYIQKNLKSIETDSNKKKYFKWLPERMKGKGFIALCEMFVVRSISSPLFIPIRVWITIRLLQE
jgi:hypothetical protein